MDMGRGLTLNTSRTVTWAVVLDWIKGERELRINIHLSMCPDDGCSLLAASLRLHPPEWSLSSSNLADDFGVAVSAR